VTHRQTDRQKDGETDSQLFTIMTPRLGAKINSVLRVQTKDSGTEVKSFAEKSGN